MSVREEDGEKFDLQAHIRYELVDIEGNQGQWDMLTNQIYNVGSIQANNGLKVMFLSDTKNIELDDHLLLSSEESDFKVLSNGLLMARSDYDGENLVLRGQNINTDIFLRKRQQRYTWDEELLSYRLAGSFQEDDPLGALKEILESEDPETSRKELVKTVREIILERRAEAIEKIDKLSDEDESAYFQSLEERGVSREMVQSFLLMETMDWKTVLKGKIQRKSPREAHSFLEFLEEESTLSLKSSLENELNDPSLHTCWDQLRRLMEPEILVAQNQEVIKARSDRI